MPTDLTRETPLVLVKDIPKLPLIPPRRNGGRMNQRTGFRWVFNGLNGLYLESTLIGGRRYTSVPALVRFFAAVTASRAKKAGVENAPGACRARANPDKVEAELDRLGL